MKPSNNNPGLSIIIPCYRPGDSFFAYLSELAVSDSSFDFEIIVVDDNSPEPFSQRLPSSANVIFYRNPRNLGPGISRIVGLALAHYSHAAFLDCDDRFSEDFFSSLNDNEFLNYDFFCYGRKLMPNGDSILPLGSAKKIISSGELFFESCISGSMGFICSKIVKINRIKIDPELFKDRVDFSEDILFNLCFFSEPELSIFYLPKPLYLYFRNPDGLSSNMKAEKINNFLRFAELRESFLIRHHYSLADYRKALSNHFLYGLSFVIKSVIYSRLSSFSDIRYELILATGSARFRDSVLQFNKKSFNRSDRFVISCLKKRLFLLLYFVLRVKACFR